MRSPRKSNLLGHRSPTPTATKPCAVLLYFCTLVHLAIWCILFLGVPKKERPPPVEISNPRVAQALLVLANYLLEKGPDLYPEEEAQVLKNLFDERPELPGAKRFLNHKTIWPHHIRPIEMFLRVQNEFVLTLAESKQLVSLLHLLQAELPATKNNAGPSS